MPTTTSKPMHVNDAFDQITSAVLGYLSAEHSDQTHAHSADDLWYNREQVQLAARALVNATDAATSSSDIPVGWRPASTGAATDQIGAVRRRPDGLVIAVLWPSSPDQARWMTSDRWGSCGYLTDEQVADWPVVGAMPFSPAAGVAFPDATPVRPTETLPLEFTS